VDAGTHFFNFIINILFEMQIKLILAVTTLIFLSFSVISCSADIEKNKIKLIDELLDITGAATIGEATSASFIQYFTATIKQSTPDTDPRALELLEEVTNEVVHEKLVVGRGFELLTHPIYDKYLTSEELAGLIKFYKTPLGQKIIRVMPAIMQESAQAGWKLGESMRPEIKKKLMVLYEKEGIKANITRQ
jgi:hypothetical protein